jgi:hypothetical protein
MTEPCKKESEDMWRMVSRKNGSSHSGCMIMLTMSDVLEQVKKIKKACNELIWEVARWS